MLYNETQILNKRSDKNQNFIVHAVTTNMNQTNNTNDVCSQSRCSGSLTHVLKLLKLNRSYLSKVNKIKKTLLDFIDLIPLFKPDSAESFSRCVITALAG